MLCNNWLADCSKYRQNERRQEDQVTAASKIARLADLAAYGAVRLSHRLSSGASGNSSAVKVPELPEVRETPAEDFVRNAGQLLQHTGTKQKDFTHGSILYQLVRNVCEKIPAEEQLNILEIGTARGFSSLVMAKALDDAGRGGVVVTVDIVRHDTPSYSAPIGDRGQRFSRSELLRPWLSLVNSRVLFVCGSSKVALELLQSQRFPFVFIDEHHVYRNTHRDLEYAARHQRVGDVIVLDDYSADFPGVVVAVDEFVLRGKYTFSTESVSARRSLAVLTRIS